LKVRFSQRLSAQTQASEGEVCLTQPVTVHDLILALYTLFPGLMANVPGRANPEVIDRRLRLICNGQSVHLADLVDDRDILMVVERAELEGV
jgi:hypothetical protein